MTGIHRLKTISNALQVQSLTLSLIDSQPMKNTSQVAKFKVLLNHLVCHLTLNNQDYWHLSVHELKDKNYVGVFGLLQHCSSDDSIVIQVPEMIVKSWSMLDVNALSVALINIWELSVTKGAAVISKGAAGDVMFVELMKVMSKSGMILTAEKGEEYLESYSAAGREQV